MLIYQLHNISRNKTCLLHTPLRLYCTRLLFRNWILEMCCSPAFLLVQHKTELFMLVWTTWVHNIWLTVRVSTRHAFSAVSRTTTICGKPRSKLNLYWTAPSMSLRPLNGKLTKLPGVAWEKRQPLHELTTSCTTQSSCNRAMPVALMDTTLCPKMLYWIMNYQPLEADSAGQKRN